MPHQLLFSTFTALFHFIMTMNYFEQCWTHDEDYVDSKEAPHPPFTHRSIHSSLLKRNFDHIIYVFGNDVVSSDLRNVRSQKRYIHWTIILYWSELLKEENRKCTDLESQKIFLQKLDGAPMIIIGVFQICYIHL